MRKIKLLLVSLYLISFIGCSHTQNQEMENWQLQPVEPFKKGQKVLILSPHPDDESIACAGIIQEAIAAGARVKIIYLTNGDHNELAFIVYEKRLVIRKNEFVYMGKVRQKESINAMKFLGIPENDLVFLGYPDFGTFEIFCNYWQAKRPFKDKLTRIAYVPYKDDPCYGSPYDGENILNDLTQQILDYKPDKIFVSHPADHNVDHKSLYLFLQIALSDLEGKVPKPKVYPYLVHFVGWPIPRHYHPELELNPPARFHFSKIDWERFELSFDQLDNKYKSIMFYRSQTSTSAFYLLAFARANELFGDYPVLELKPQPSLKDKVISYFGATGMVKEAQAPQSQDQPQLEEAGTVSYAEEDGYFIVRVDKPKKLSSRFGVLVYIFGYSKETPFAKMPKIRIITFGKKCMVFNGKDKVLGHGVSVGFGSNWLAIKIPLKLLQNPDYLLTSLKAYHGRIPIDAVGFRKIKIK